MLRLGTRVLLLVVALTAGCNLNQPAKGSVRNGIAPQAQPGDVALDYVSGDTYPSLLAEVDYVEGNEPSHDALVRMRDIFARRLVKPLGIEWMVDSKIPLSQAKMRYQVGDILALEQQYRANRTGDTANKNQAVIWVVFLNGESEFDDPQNRALGISYDASSVAVFKENIERTTALEARDVVEAMVLVHEGGHLFGLVNNGIPMTDPHEDLAHPRHDANPDCVMYHRIETSDVKKLLESPPIDFDYACRADMYAVGGPFPGDAPSGGTAPSPVTSTVTVPPTSRRNQGPLLDTAHREPAPLHPLMAPARK